MRPPRDAPGGVPLMRDPACYKQELDDLLHAFCDGRLDRRGHQRLTEILESSDEACRRYIDFVHLCVTLSYPSTTGSLSSAIRIVDGDWQHYANSIRAHAASQASHPASIAHPETGNKQPNRTNFAATSWLSIPAFNAGKSTVFITVIACAILFAGLVWMNHSPNNKPVATLPQNTTSTESTPASPLGQNAVAKYVARIVKKSGDCTWGALSAPSEFLLRVQSNDRMHLASGLVELEFFSGARIILHGPAVFIPTGAAAGRLESGRLTGKVADGNFRLVTPTAEVIDLGTEFGVVADASVGTDVVVFDGRVQVVSLPDNSGAGEVLDMTEGMAARFRSDGTTEYGLKTHSEHFSRQIPISADAENRDELCLIDVFAGGDGFGKRLAGAIDPATSQRDYGQLPIQFRWSDKTYHAVPWHSMIDGVFVPTSDGRDVQVDTAGNRVNLPVNTGCTYGSLWARRRESIIETGSGACVDFWGSRTLPGIIAHLKHVGNGMIAMHSNSGITFDLRTMQMTHDRAPNAFRAVVTNLENSRDFKPEEILGYPRTADFRVFVDGQPRFERLGFRREDGEQNFDVSLSPRDRFLTLVVTDDGSLEFDHVMLIDPVIALQDESINSPSR